MANVREEELNELFLELKGVNKDIAFQKIYTQYNKLIYGIAFGILKNKEDAEDIVQIFFSKLYTIEKEKLPREKIASWIYTVIKNEAISLLRKKKDHFDIETIYEIEDKDNEINNLIDKEEFNKLISKLDDKEREIITLKIIAGLPFEEIAKLLNKPSGTIKWRYYKSIHTLKLLLSNLAMFILTFVIGLKTLFNKESKIESNEEEKIENNILEDTNETLKSETTEDVINSTNDELDKIYENTIVEESHEHNINYIGIGILSMSSIFLCITIIFTLLFIKYQLKSRKKTSK
ncbi:MAG: sigma-70 family RNA polymerase sigma factor [Clostridia bacterium]|nr:sigma-70 family RNA polymerase sigma factor [Clostridia bacterium]